MSYNSLNNAVNEAGSDNCEGLSPGSCPTGKQRGPDLYQITARRRWTKKEMKESRQGYRKRMYNLWNEMGIFEIEEQHLTRQVRSIIRNKRLTKVEIQQLRKEIEKGEIAPEGVDTVLEMSYGGSSGAETFREQCCDLGDYPGAHRRSY